MKSTSSTKRSGFTLIELLTVIAIIGILASVLVPSIQAVIKKAKKSNGASKAHNIALSLSTFSDGKKYIKSGPWTVATNTSASSIAEYAAVLAYNSDLNTGELWYVDADKLNENATYPKLVLIGGPGSEQINPKFKTPSVQYGYHSWTAYVPTPKTLNPVMPVIWSRGLSSAGVWDEATGVWGSEGGHIGYGDGHVEWVANTVDDDSGSHTGIFFHRLTDQHTQDWKLAVSKDVTATELSSK